MLSKSKDKDMSIRDTCKKAIVNWPWVADHMNKDFDYQKKEYLKGFYVENIFNNKILNFTKNFKQDSRLINNEINNIILKNRNSFSLDNDNNNLLLEEEIKKLNSTYKKIISKSESDLDKIIKSQLDEIVRYKIFVNDTENFLSYSCNWKP